MADSASVHVTAEILETSLISEKRLFLEFFGGSCRLTREFSRRGDESLAIDWQHNLNETEGSAISVDLGSQAGQQL
jgi:hypothetical protein